MSAPIYAVPDYLVKAAQKKYGRRISVLGVLQNSLDEFWDTVEAKASNFNQQDFPEEVGRAIVDITAKEHCNYGDKEADKISVTTSQEEMQRQNKTYTLSFGKQSGWEFGGNVNVGASFFNVASGSIGLGGSKNRSQWQSQQGSRGNEFSLSKTYGVSGEIEVPPRTKVTVTITTHAVTYKTYVKVVFTIPVTSAIEFHYKSQSKICCCGGGGNQIIRYGSITARELFQNENEFQEIGGCNLQFTKESELSYLSETAEMRKTETPL